VLDVPLSYPGDGDMDKLHDLALEVARQTLAPDPEFPELIELARELLKATLREQSLDSANSEAAEWRRFPTKR
jgi:hypothetical protein